jgi:hypothetical protein
MQRAPPPAHPPPSALPLLPVVVHHSGSFRIGNGRSHERSTLGARRATGWCRTRRVPQRVRRYQRRPHRPPSPPSTQAHTCRPGWPTCGHVSGDHRLRVRGRQQRAASGQRGGRQRGGRQRAAAVDDEDLIVAPLLGRAHHVPPRCTTLHGVAAMRLDGAARRRGALRQRERAGGEHLGGNAGCRYGTVPTLVSTGCRQLPSTQLSLSVCYATCTPHTASSNLPQPTPHLAKVFLWPSLSRATAPRAVPYT